MSRYIQAQGDGSGSMAMPSGKCATAAAVGSWGAVAFDKPTDTPPIIVPIGAALCWLISGRKVIIGPFFHSKQGAFEMVNFNFHIDGTQQPVPTLMGLGAVA